MAPKLDQRFPSVASHLIHKFSLAFSPMSSLVPALERGKACVECRRRKQKCDGIQPACSSCVRASRSCRYEKPVTRPVSIVLQERLTELESKLRDLMKNSRSGSSEPSSAAGGPFHSGIPADAPPEMTGKWWEQPTLDPAVHDYLFMLFWKHHTRVHFYMHVPTFHDRMLSADPQSRPHPGLLNAIYLMGCFFTSLDTPGYGALARHESYFLSRAQTLLMDSLALSDRLMDFVRGSNLVSAYLLMKGRFLEGYHAHCALARFTLSCGLHQIVSHKVPPQATIATPGTIVLLPTPETSIELGERLLAFWMIYWWDKLSATLMGFVAALPSSFETVEPILTVFPYDIEDYGDLDDEHNESIQDIIRTDLSTPASKKTAGRRDTAFTMLLKSVTLLEAAHRLKLAHQTRPGETTIRGLRELHAATDRFAETLPPVASPNPVITNLADDPEATLINTPSVPYDQFSVLEARTMTLGAILEMNRATADTDPQAYNARLMSSSYIAALVYHFGEDNLSEACLGTAYCWCMAGRHLVEHAKLLQTQKSPTTGRDSPVQETTNHGPTSLTLVECESQLTRVLMGLEKLSVLYPSLAPQVQFVLTSLSGITAE